MNNSNLEISKMLCISTAHITQKTSQLLCDEAIKDVTYYNKGDWGFFIYVPTCIEENTEADIPEDLQKVMDFARMNDCLWVMLDCAASVVDELPKYEW